MITYNQDLAGVSKTRKDVGFIVPAHTGFNATTILLQELQCSQLLRDAVSGIERNDSNGAVLCWRNVCFIQTNASPYYKTHHLAPPTGAKHIWRDYYYSAYYLAITHLIDMGIDQILVDHPIQGCEWPDGLWECFLEASKNLCLSRKRNISCCAGCCGGHGIAAINIDNSDNNTHREFNFSTLASTDNSMMYCFTIAD